MCSIFYILIYINKIKLIQPFKNEGKFRIIFNVNYELCHSKILNFKTIYTKLRKIHVFIKREKAIFVINNNVMDKYKFTAEITKDHELNQYIGIVPGLPGAHTQASTLDELQINLKEVIELCLEELSEEEIKNLPDFIGFQQISVAV